MASVNEINIGGSSNMNYYDPKEGEKNKYVSLVPKQLYPCHAKEMTSREVTVKGKYKAKVFNIVYEIAEECAALTFDTEQGQVSGASFVGKKLYANGIFMFLNPCPVDNFEANNGGNETYLRFCEAIKVNCPEVEVDVDGEKRMVKQFPELTEADVVGSPIMGYVDKQMYKNAEGEDKVSYKVKSFTEWSEGKKRDLDGESLPF